MEQVRFGVIGAGWISQIAFLPALPQTRNATVTALVSGNRQGASQLAEFYGIDSIHSYEEYDELLNSDRIDAVYIALPNSMHAEYTIKAAKAGKHVLVEKPLATSVADCEAMIAACNEAGVWLMTAYRLHCEPGTVEFLEQLRSGVIGEPRVFSSVFCLNSAPDNHRLKAEHWGGPLQDIGIYCLNAARHVFGTEPVEATATKGFGNNDARFTEVEETIAVNLRFPGDCIAQFVASFGGDDIDALQVVGTKGVLSLDPAYGFQVDTVIHHREGGVMQASQAAQECDHFAAQATYFADCIQQGKRPVSGGEEGLADVHAMLAIEKAAESGQAQRITGLDHRQGSTNGPSRETLRVVPRTERRLLL